MPPSATAFHVTLGVLGRYRVAIEDGRTPPHRDLVVDALTFGILMLVTILLANQLRLDRGGCVVAGAGVGICGTHAVRWFRNRRLAQRLHALWRVTLRLAQRLPADRRIVQLAEVGCAADIVKVSAGVDVPDGIGAHSGTPYDDLSRAGAALQEAFCRPTITQLPADQIELLRRRDLSAE